MKQFTIIEEKWVRGEELHNKKGYSALLNNQGNMCCLGFLCRAKGISKKRIDGYGMPADVLHESRSASLVSKLGDLVLATGSGYYENNPIVREIASINDDATITDQGRKDKLAPLFKTLGWKPIYV